jgi:hypothetical protein
VAHDLGHVVAQAPAGVVHTVALPWPVLAVAALQGATGNCGTAEECSAPLYSGALDGCEREQPVECWSVPVTAAATQDSTCKCHSSHAYHIGDCSCTRQAGLVETVGDPARELAAGLICCQHPLLVN